MTDDYFLGMYWGAREQDLEVCTTKIYDTFYFLREFDSSFKQWYRTNKPRKGQVIEPIGLDRESLATLLRKGQNYNDLGELLEDLGYLLYLKSCKNNSKAHILSVSCGSYAERIINSVTLTIGKNEEYKHLMDAEVLKRIFSGLADIWHPDSGKIQCNNEEVFSKNFLTPRFDS